MITTIDNVIKKTISGLGVFVMFVIILNSIFSPTLSHIASYWRKGTELNVVRIQNALSFVFAIIIIISFFWIIKKIRLKDKISNLIAIILSVLFFIFLLWQFNFLQIDGLIDDSYVVFNAAQEILDTGKLSGWYMASNPQNLFIMYFYMFLIKLTGSVNIEIIYIFFAALHVLTSLLLYFNTKKLFNMNCPALIALIVFIFTFQINMHVIIMYTDVFSMFFLMLGIYFFISYTQSKSNKSKLIYLLLSSLFFSFAFLAKGLYLILFIAIVLGMLISLKGKEKLLGFIPMIVFLLINIAWNGFISNQGIFEKEEIGMPNTHYIFMGMNTNDYFQDKENKEYRLAGAYSEGDLNFSKDLYWDQNLEKKEIVSIHLEKISERIHSISLLEFFDFLNAKVSSTWSSGDLKSTVSIGMATSSEDGLEEIRESKFVYTYLQVIQYVYYLMFLLSFIKLLLVPSMNSFLYVSVFFVIGIFFFILMWESSPRYSMTIMPFAPVIFPYFFYDFNKKEIENEVKV